MAVLILVIITNKTTFIFGLWSLFNSILNLSLISLYSVSIPFYRLFRFIPLIYATLQFASLDSSWPRSNDVIPDRNSFRRSPVDLSLRFWSFCPSPWRGIPCWCSVSPRYRECQKETTRWTLDSESVFWRASSFWQFSDYCTANIFLQ